MKTTLSVASALVLSLIAACGDPKPARSPDTEATTETSSQEDMPAPPSKEGDAPAPADTSASATGPESAGPAGGVIKLAAMKLTPVKKNKDKAIELKEDGSVSIDGKPAAKIKGDQVDSAGGTSMLTVGLDGSLVGNGVQPGYKFEGDELVHDSGSRLSVGDDGKISVTRNGKSEAIVTTDGGATTAKRAALIATVLWMTVPTGKPGAKASKK